MQSSEMFQFKGIRNDVGIKFVPQDYFYSTSNITQDDIGGFNKVLCPSLISLVDQYNKIDGIFNYSYLQLNISSNVYSEVIQNIQIIACGGKLYQNINNPTLIYSGMSIGKCQSAIFNDKLFIVNGIDYPLIYNGATGNTYQMGAPEAIVQSTSGVLNGSYYYAVTYVTSGGEEVLGTVSNTINPFNKQVVLNLPIGYAGTLSRKIYRTSASGTNLKLLATISDNVTLTYTDNIADSSLTSVIPSINNECPRPKYITTSSTFNLVMAGDKTFPTQCYVTDTNVEIIDKANYVDISNRSVDNSPITGLSDDYGLIIVGTQKQIYFLNTSASPYSVTITRSNIGILDGYSIVKMPSNSGFAGGIMFVASDRTIRVMNGNYSDPVPTSLDNIKTENWAQPIRGTLNAALQCYANIHGEYFDYKYHLCVDSTYFVFDTRTLSWNNLQFKTENNLSIPNILVNFNNQSLYIGRSNGGYIEKMYSDTLYIGEDLPAFVNFPYWVVSEDLKFFRELHIYYLKQADLDIIVNYDIGDNSNENNSISITETSTAVFDSDFYDSNYYATGSIKEDYKVIYLNQYGTWINFQIQIPANDKIHATFDSRYFDPTYYATELANINPFGNMAFIRGIRVLYDDVNNREAVT